MSTYICEYYDPKQNIRGQFTVTARNIVHANIQTRDGFFGLLAPPTDERRAELDVKVRECG
jgi:hypothetical protein